MSTAKAPETFESVAERLIAISITKPHLSETFVPWEMPLDAHHKLMPESLLSLYGHELFDTLTKGQQRELARAEVVQVMQSYAWSEAMACLFFNRHLLTLQTASVEHRFLLRELIEEFRHQEMFARAITTLNGRPLPQSRLHQIWGRITVEYFPADILFMSILGIELASDAYGKALQKSSDIYPVLAKVAELHSIEEGRHIVYTQWWLKRYTENAGWLRRSFYSLLVCMNIRFMRTLYVRKEIFERMGVTDPERYAAAAEKGLREKFGANALDEAIKFVQSFNGFNAITKIVWRRILNAAV